MRTPTNPVPAVTTEGSDDTALHPRKTPHEMNGTSDEADVYEVHNRYVRSRFNPCLERCVAGVMRCRGDLGEYEDVFVGTLR